MSDEPVDPYYQNQAKQFINTLHDRGYFCKDVTREEMQLIEDLLAFLYRSHVDMAVKCSEMLRRAKEPKSDG